MTAANLAVSARNEELAAANLQLTRTNQDLDNFVYAASHDLKQPVNNLAGLFDEMRQSTVFTDPEEKELLVPMVDDALRRWPPPSTTWPPWAKCSASRIWKPKPW
ncbi:hypothetical protein ACFQT0_20910 [Hymenobacter humi]|uniref:histidine kinase n=1 Tax=Hymenobacter humi TaxID=1411620 RepID=A0ABW2UAS5_9BACT